MQTPVTAASNKNPRFDLTMFNSVLKYFQANGKMIRVADSQRKKASVTGGISFITPLAMMKLPDQISVARTARPIPE